jgi:hypothetical protein
MVRARLLSNLGMRKSNRLGNRRPPLMPQCKDNRVFDETGERGESGYLESRGNC